MIGFNGGLVGSTRTPSTSSASGVWTSNEQANAQRTGTWPLGPVDYVTSGLQLYLDAGKTNSYSGTGNSWNDISGNSRNATLSNTTFDSTDGGGTIVFNGSNAAGQVSGTISSLTSATFQAFIKVSVSQTNYRGIIYSRGSVAAGIHAEANRINIDWGNAGSRSHSTAFALDEWIMITATIGSDVASFYQNRASGQTTSTATLSTATSITLDDIDIGQDDLGGRFFNGKIAIAMIYNRALSSTEVTQNWNTFKGRFGIT